MSKFNQMWATDLIGQDYKTWNNEKILLGLGTGRGKTTFALDVYCPYLLKQNKKILYLCNRNKLEYQTMDHIKDEGLIDKIDIKTYQSLVGLIENKAEEPLPKYDVYICDEAHYFLADSGFNLYTDIVYKFLLTIKDSVIIYMTATYQNIFPRIRNDLKKISENYQEPKSYILPTKYSDYAEKIVWFKKPSDIYGIIDTILRTTDDKVLYFCNSISMMQKFYNHYSPYKGNEKDTVKNELIENSNLKYMDFVCSDHSRNKFAVKHSNPDAIIKGSDGGYTFSNRVLVSTKCIDNGVDFKDRRIKHVICDIFDLESAIQCLGRKRVLNEDDTCIFYIRDWQNWSVRAFMTNIQKELDPVVLYETDYPTFTKQYGNDRTFTNSVLYYSYDKEKKGSVKCHINTLKFEKLKQDMKFVQAIFEKRIQYKDKVLEYFAEYAPELQEGVEDIEQDRVKDAIEIFMDMHLEEKLTKELQEELVDICDLKDGWGRKLTSIGSLNSYFETFKYPYEIESKRIQENGERKRYWIIHIRGKTNKK